MKTVKASEARKHWFRLLDEAIGGEVIAVERNGHRVLLRRETPADRRSGVKAPDYKQLLKMSEVETADQWSWEWRPDRALRSHRRSRR
jgi:hypothetical protein